MTDIESKQIGHSLPVVFHNAFQDHLIDGSHKLTYDFNANGHLFKNIAGLGGAAGKAIRICGTEAEIKSACEDVAVFWVLILEGTYTFDASITPTTYTRIFGLGEVKLDWDGATDGNLFRLDNDYMILERLRFVATGNVYRTHQLGNHHRFIDITYASNNAEVVNAGDYSVFTRCWIASGNHYVEDDFINYVDCTFTGSLLHLRGGRGARFSRCSLQVSSRVQVYGNAAYHSDRDIVFTGCLWRNLASVACFRFVRTGASTVRNIKFLGCNFEPLNNTVPCILVSNNADMTVEDVLFNGCTFRDAASAFEIPNGVQNRWRFNNGIYTSVINRYNFTGGTQNDFIYTMDG